MLANLRRQYALGQEALRAEGKLSSADFAEQHGLSEHSVRKLKRFADVYSEQEFEEFALKRRSDGLPLHWGYVNYLLIVHDRGGVKARKKYEDLAVKNDWLAPQLYAAIRQEFGSATKKPHGRKAKLPADLPTAIRQVAHEANVLGQRCEMLRQRWKPSAKSKRADIDQREELINALKGLRSVVKKFIDNAAS